MMNYQIVDAIDASVYWKDLSGKYLGCNQYMAQMIGLSRDQIIGSTDYLLPWKDQGNRIREIDLLVIENRKTYQVEEKALVSGGIYKTFLSTKSPLYDDGKIIGVIGVSIDIAHHKRFEKEVTQTERELDKYSSIKTRFFRNISHEVRVPLGAILSLAETLKNQWNKLEDKIKYQKVATIFSEMDRISNFMINTFDLSSFVKKEIKIQLKSANFSQFVRDVVAQYQKKYCDVRIELEINHFDDYRCSFDQNLIERVIQNLMMNAVQYSYKKKKLTIGVYKTYLRNTKIPAIQFCITDEGIGIPENEIESIFDPFTESSITASQACGTGLGLSICKEIIEIHSGHIWVENNLLKSGVTFNFVIPTNLVAISSDSDDSSKSNVEAEEVADEPSNIINRDLRKQFIPIAKDPFALIGISPFNSYFSADKILTICEWIHHNYNDFAMFIPDEISRYTFEALGYTESRISTKVRKQDNYTINKINSALSCFYTKYPEKKGKVKLYTYSQLWQEKSFQDLYLLYLSMYNNDKDFKQNCLEVTEWVLQNNNSKQVAIGEFQKELAVRYFLFELPIMTCATDILNIEACDFVYHQIPKFLRCLYIGRELVAPKQRLLVLK